MTPIGPISTSADSVVSHVIRRSYPFSVLPVSRRNTFTGATVQLNTPVVKFMNGATVESNRIYEASVESGDSVDAFPYPMGPGPTIGSDFVTSFDCMMSNHLPFFNDSDNIGSDAFMGIEIFSQNRNTLINNPVGTSFQLKWQFKDQTKWMLSSYLGNSIVGRHQSFSIEPTPEGVNQALGGHKVRLLLDPFNLIVKAYVDDILRATESIKGMVPYNDNNADIFCGIILYNGTQTGAYTIVVSWMGAEVCTYNANAVGSGAV